MGEPGDVAMVEHVGGGDAPRSRRAVELAFVSMFIYARGPMGRERLNEAAMEESTPMPKAAMKLRVTESIGRGTGGVGKDEAEANPMEDEDSADQM